MIDSMKCFDGSQKVLEMPANSLVTSGEKETEFHCGIEESGFHAYNCNDCPNKCEEWHQWDKEVKEDGSNEV